jgi:two-component system cell cycle sensor histidine kinase/response regulator CckA
MRQSKPKITKEKDFRGILNSLRTAVINYDQEGQLESANNMAYQIIPNLSDLYPTFKEFIHFIYDSSVDSIDQSDLTTQFHTQELDSSFLEVIEVVQGMFYLVRVIHQFDGSIIIELSDISAIKNKSDNIRTLGRDNKILSEVIHSSNQGILVASNKADGEIIFVNTTLTSLLGHSQIESLIGLNAEVFFEIYFSSEWTEIKQVLKNGGRGTFWQQVKGNNDNQKWLYLNLSVEENHQTEGLIIAFLADETETKIKENQLLQSQKLEAIGKLAGGIAHDFNNILSIIDGYIRLSQTSIQRGDDVSKNFERIKQAVSRGSGLTNQLLMFGKHRVSENKYLDICRGIHEIKELLSPLLGPHIQLDISVPKEAIVVRVTQDFFTQIIMNLVINARDAMPEGGRVKISISTIKKNNIQNARVVVEDDGSGIPDTIIRKIFDPFFTTKEQGKGTGLGLYMVYGIITQIGGNIDVHSVVGEGTKFTFEIPIADGPALIESPVNEVTDSQLLTNKTILLAEDDIDLLNIMEATLVDFGLKVIKARNGQEALVIQDAYDEKIDFLLTDMVMPEVGGLKLASLISEVRPETKIIFMSGYPVRGEISDIKLPEGAIFLAKPVQSDTLRKILENSMSNQNLPVSQLSTYWE